MPLGSARVEAGRLPEPQRRTTALELRDVSRSFGAKTVLDGVSLAVDAGEIAALLGPNGAGKTTLLRIASGLIDRDAGSVRVLGAEIEENLRRVRQRIGFVPSGDRSFYLRLSGLENLVFFARLHGLSRSVALVRACEVLEQVGLGGAERVRVGVYSHGMQKRLSVARALLMRAEVLLFDEATHDLDPEGAAQVRSLVGELAAAGAAVVWATQRLDEIRAFAESVTLLGGGRVRFHGSVHELMSLAQPRSFVLGVSNGVATGPELEALLRRAVEGVGTVSALADGAGDDFLLLLGESVVLGDALQSLLAAGVQVHACREERSPIEEAFRRLSHGAAS